MQLMLILLVVSTVCFTIAKAILIGDFEVNTILLAGLYCIIAGYCFWKLVDRLDIVKGSFGKEKGLGYLFMINGVLIPPSVLIENHPQLTQYLIIQFTILLVVGVIYAFIKSKKKKRK